MHIDLAQLSPNQVYFTLIQTLIPRPVAWVLSENVAGDYNLAPFSYFNAVCSDPPLILLSIGVKPDGTPKDTRVNIEARSHFVVHIAHRELAAAVTESSRTLAYGASEVTRAGLETVPFPDFALPRLKDCRVAYACERYEVREIGNAQQALVLGEVSRIYIDDAAVTLDARGRLDVSAARIDPIARLGGPQYTTFGEVLDIPRPK
jgi:flavin reductase (DIM6/NTAB) family NADH-FMN oxidoreductase RutF